MAKAPEPGRVKTRLTARLSAEAAAAAHAAMMACVLTRVAAHLSAKPVLALAGRLPAEEVGAATGLEVAVDPAYEVVDQGEGDLGERLASVWRRVGGGRAVFFGVDSPDVPIGHLGAIPAALAEHDAAVGPVDDGGYWTLAANRLEPALLAGIDWGTANVYHQTRAAAGRAGLDLADLPPWRDVDEPADLDALCRRLRSADEPALIELRRRLDALPQPDTTP